MRTIYLNGDWVPEGQARISVFDRAVLFADAVYEVFAVLAGRSANIAYHHARLSRSLNQLGMAPALSEDELGRIVTGLIRRNDLREGIVYLQVSRGQAADRDFLFPPEDTPPTVFAFAQARALVDNPMAERGMRIVTRPDRRWGRRDIKTTQLLYASLMKMEVKAAGVDDAWLVQDGLVTEGTSQNAHIVDRRGRLVTHPLSTDILPGVTRIGTLEIARDMGLEVEERGFGVEEALEAREAFTSSASLFIMPVIEIDGHRIGDGRPGPVARAIRARYVERIGAPG